MLFTHLVRLTPPSLGEGRSITRDALSAPSVIEDATFDRDMGEMCERLCEHFVVRPANLRSRDELHVPSNPYTDSKQKPRISGAFDVGWETRIR